MNLTLKETLLRLNAKWVSSNLNLAQFAKLNGMTEMEMNMVLIMVQSWNDE